MTATILTKPALMLRSLARAPLAKPTLPQISRGWAARALTTGSQTREALAQIRTRRDCWTGSAATDAAHLPSTAWTCQSGQPTLAATILTKPVSILRPLARARLLGATLTQSSRAWAAKALTTGS